METNIPTNQGNKTPVQIMDWLTYSSYAANRDYGMDDRGFVRLGILSDQQALAFAAKYEADGGIQGSKPYIAA